VKRISEGTEVVGSGVVVPAVAVEQRQAPLDAEDPAFGVLDYAAILWKFRWILVVPLAIGIAGAVALSFRQNPTYRSTLQLEVQELNQNFLDVSALDPTATSNAAAPDSYIQVQAQVLQSEVLLKRVVGRLRLDEQEGYIAQSVSPAQRIAGKLGIDKLLSVLKPQHQEVIRNALGLPVPELDSAQARALRVAAANLKIKVAAQSSLIELFYTDRDRFLPAEFLNTLAEEYVAHTMDARWAGMERTAGWLNTRLHSMKENLEASERKLQSYARNSGMLYKDDRESVGEERLRQVQAEWSKAQAERAVLQANYERIKANRPEQLPQVLDHPVLRDYATRLADLQRELSKLTITMMPEHQQVRAVQSQIIALKDLIRIETEKVLGRIQNEYEAASRREALLAGSYEQQWQVVAEQAGLAVPYNVLKREVESKRKFYEETLERVNSAGVATAIRASNIRVMNPAREPMLPYRPDLLLNLLAGSGAGLLFGIAGCFLGEAAERRSKRLRRPGDAVKYLGIAELGAIPPLQVVTEGRSRWRLGGGRIGRVNAGLLEAGESQPATWYRRSLMMNESFQSTLDSMLCTFAGSEPPQVASVMSALPLEGKTTITSHLGLALADISKRVLLIDADMRKPALNVQFNVANGTGLSGLLESDTLALDEIQAAIVKTATPGLDLLPAGTLPENVARLLASGRFAEILQHLRPLYSNILIDTPPVLLFPEARVFGRFSDGVVLVVRSNQNPLAVHQQAMQRLQRAGNAVLGIILNDCSKSAEYNARYYRMYARY
jgi:capsular exopolysaccharide synthesis family protein